MCLVFVWLKMILAIVIQALVSEEHIQLQIRISKHLPEKAAHICQHALRPQDHANLVIAQPMFLCQARTTCRVAGRLGA